MIYFSDKKGGFFSNIFKKHKRKDEDNFNLNENIDDKKFYVPKHSILDKSDNLDSYEDNHTSDIDKKLDKTHDGSFILPDLDDSIKSPKFFTDNPNSHSLIKTSTHSLSKPISEILHSETNSNFKDEFLDELFNKEYKKLEQEINILINNLEGTLSPEHYLKLKDGTVFKSLNDLRKNISKLSSKTFEHHVNDVKNDIQTWVSDVLKLEDLASKLRKIKAKEELELILLDHDFSLKAKLEEKQKQLLHLKQANEKLLESYREKHTSYLNKLNDLKKVEQELNSQKEQLDSLKSTLNKRETELDLKLAQLNKSLVEFSLEKEKFNSNLEKERNDLEVEFNEKKEKLTKYIHEREKFLEEQYESLKSKLLSDIELKRLELQKLEKTLHEKESQLDLSYKLKQQALDKQQHFLDVRSEKLDLLEKQLNSKSLYLDKRFKELTELEQKINNKINKNKSLLSKISEERLNLEKEQETLSHNEFKKYIEHELKNINSKHEPDIKINPDSKSNVSILENLLKKGYDYLNAGDLEHAKQVYVDLKDKFSTLHLSHTEQSVLYIKIREFYTAIKLNTI